MSDYKVRPIIHQLYESKMTGQEKSNLWKGYQQGHTTYIGNEEGDDTPKYSINGYVRHCRKKQKEVSA